MEQKNFPADSVPVQRYFQYVDDRLIMHSRTKTEFGSCLLVSSIQFYPTDPNDDEDGRVYLDIRQTIDDRFDQNPPLEFRVGEMNYLLSISLLFNPKNITDYGVPQASESEDLP